MQLDPLQLVGGGGSVRRAEPELISSGMEMVLDSGSPEGGQGAAAESPYDIAQDDSDDKDWEEGSEKRRKRMKVTRGLNLNEQ